MLRFATWLRIKKWKNGISKRESSNHVERFCPRVLPKEIRFISLNLQIALSHSASILASRNALRYCSMTLLTRALYQDLLYLTTFLNKFHQLQQLNSLFVQPSTS